MHCIWVLRSALFLALITCARPVCAQELRPIPPGPLLPDSGNHEHDETNAGTEIDIDDLVEIHPLMRGQRRSAFRTLGFTLGSSAATWAMLGACWLDGETSACRVTQVVMGLSALGFLGNYVSTIYFSHQASRELRRMGANVAPTTLYAGAGLLALTAITAPLARSGEAVAWTSVAGALAFLSPFFQVIVNRVAYDNLARRTQIAVVPELHEPGIRLLVAW